MILIKGELGICSKCKRLKRKQVLWIELSFGSDEIVIQLCPRHLIEKLRQMISDDLRPKDEVIPF